MRINNKIVDNITLNNKTVIKITDIEGKVLYQKYNIDYFWIECGSDVAPSLRFIDEGADENFYSNMATKFEYSFDKKNWVTVRLDEVGQTGYTITDGVNKRVYFRNDENAWSGGNDTLTRWLNFNSATNCGGDLRTLINYNDIENVELPNACFGHLFRDSSITDASQLKIAKTGTFAYHWFFKDCHELTVAPSLPATQLADHCYSSMFRDCYSLEKAPELPATELAPYCYYYMFYVCTSLKAAPSLPATTLADYCYHCMFRDCSSLTQSPSLPATTLAPYCYSNMFRECSSLTQAPSLPSTTLAPYCYNYMFYVCTSLTQAPELPATEMEDHCYHCMFRDCSSLNYVEHYIVNWNTTNSQNWLNGVAETGTMVCPKNSTIPTKNVSGIPTGWTREENIDYFYLENVNGENNKISLKKYGDYASSVKNVEYSTDKVNWVSATVPSTDKGVVFSVTIPSSGKLYLRGNEGKWNSRRTSDDKINRVYFETNGDYNAGGDIRTLLNYADVDNVSLYSYCFNNLFSSYPTGIIYENTHLRNASKLKLPSTTLAPYCYYNMFNMCSQLVATPSLPATELVDSCYRGMFYLCASLTAAPSLPATTLAPYCYYNMFSKCLSLTSTPYIGATSLADSCLQFMFEGCERLNYIDITNISNWNKDYAINWVSGVATNGEFYKQRGVTIPTGTNGIPEGWTVQDEIV